METFPWRNWCSFKTNSKIRRAKTSRNSLLSSPIRKHSSSRKEKYTPTITPIQQKPLKPSPNSNLAPNRKVWTWILSGAQLALKTPVEMQASSMLFLVFSRLATNLPKNRTQSLQISMTSSFPKNQQSPTLPQRHRTATRWTCLIYELLHCEYELS